MNVQTMTRDDEVRAIDTIALAFVADPVTRWVWPHAHQYLSAMPRFIRAFGGAAFAHGGAFCSDEYAGAALWLPAGIHADEKRLGELMESTASLDSREAGPAIFEQMVNYRPKEPHWYLPLIGVDPAHQGRGHGDALMRFALERFDREGASLLGVHKSTKHIPLPAARLRTHWQHPGRVRRRHLCRCCDVRVDPAAAVGYRHRAADSRRLAS